MTTRREKRLDICKKCEHVIKTPVLRCGKCGCLMHLKTAMHRAKCPINKW